MSIVLTTRYQNQKDNTSTWNGLTYDNDDDVDAKEKEKKKIEDD
jgi:hypothetical protein